MIQAATFVQSPLANIQLFKGLGDADFDWLERNSETRTFTKKDAIYQVGEASDSILFVKSGKVKVGNFAEDGREMIFSIVREGEFFGELGLIGMNTRKNFAMVHGKNAEVVVFKIDAFRSMIRKSPDLGFRMTTWIGNKLIAAEERLKEMTLDTARDRIIGFLKSSASKYGKRIGYEVLIRDCPTQMDIAKMTGTSRQTVSMVLNELKEQNLIHIDRKNILIRDMEALK